MTWVVRSILGEYFSDSDGTNKFYALVDSNPLPNLFNNKAKNIIQNTLPGDDNSTFTSGQSYNISMGCSYEIAFELSYEIIDSSFKTAMERLKTRALDFIYSPDDGTTEYYVNFNGDDSVVYTAPEHPSESIKIKLLNLGEVS